MSRAPPKAPPRFATGWAMRLQHTQMAFVPQSPKAGAAHQRHPFFIPARAPHGTVFDDSRTFGLIRALPAAQAHACHCDVDYLAKLTRFYDPLKLLGQATGVNGDLLALSGARNPYPGVVGRIAPKAWADLLVMDGNPSTGLDFLADPEKNLKLVMKDGKIYKNTL